jgi:hypothetical protein
MRLDYGALWSEAVDMIGRHRSAATALAGALFFLPALVVGYFAPAPPYDPAANLFETMIAHARAHWPLILAGTLAEMLGMLTLLRLFLKPDGRTVGAAIAASLALLPTTFAATFLANVATAIGFMLLIVPGVYLVGRLALVASAIVAEDEKNPIAAIRRSVAVTRGFGFGLALLFLTIFILASLASFAMSSALGSVAILVAGGDLGRLVAEMAGASVWAAARLVQAALAARLYLRLASSSASASGT